MEGRKWQLQFVQDYPRTGLLSGSSGCKQYKSLPRALTFWQSCRPCLPLTELHLATDFTAYTHVDFPLLLFFFDTSYVPQPRHLQVEIAVE